MMGIIVDTMSLSPDVRRKQRDLALTLMLRDLGDNFVGDTHFEANCKAFEEIKRTTWRDLMDDYLIEDKSSLTSYRYALTGLGWRTAIGLNWDQPTQDKLSSLAAALKRTVKDRQSDCFESPETIADASKLSVGWVSNAIESKLLDYKFNMKGAKWHNGGHHLIVIPINFGR